MAAFDWLWGGKPPLDRYSPINKRIMKIYILTCINEESQLVSCKAYHSSDEAKIAMVNQAVAERGEFQKANRPGQYFKPGDTKTAVGDEEYCYLWNITEDEV